jgi:hypothetical protein
LLNLTNVRIGACLTFSIADLLAASLRPRRDAGRLDDHHDDGGESPQLQRSPPGIFGRRHSLRTSKTIRVRLRKHRADRLSPARRTQSGSIKQTEQFGVCVDCSVLVKERDYFEEANVYSQMKREREKEKFNKIDIVFSVS